MSSSLLPSQFGNFMIVSCKDAFAFLMSFAMCSAQANAIDSPSYVDVLLPPPPHPPHPNATVRRESSTRGVS